MGLLDTINLGASRVSDAQSLSTPSSTSTPGMNFPLASGTSINNTGNVVKAPSVAPTTPIVPPAPKSPNPAPAPSPTYSFLDGSTYNGSGKQVNAPTVVTGKAATTDLANKQSALQQAQTAQAQQTQNLTTQQANATQNPPQETSKPATAQDLQSILNGSAGQEGSKTANNALQGAQDQADATYASFQQQIGQILNGTFPLTPSQQAQVNATQSSFDQLKVAQETANRNFEGQIKLSGLSGVAPSINLGMVKNAVDSGIQRIAAIDSQASKAVADLQQGFLDKDYAIINGAYAAASALFAQKSKTIQDMNDNVRNATNDALAQHKQAMDEAQQTLQNQQAAVQFAQQNGIKTPAYLVGNTAFNTETGQPLSLSEYQQLTGQQVGLPSDQTDFSKLQHVADPQVMALANEYKDAGILPTDTLAQATSKLQSSPLYHKATYIAGESGSGLGGLYVPGADPVVDSWVQKINSDPTNYKIANVPKALQGSVIQGLAATGGSPANDLLSVTQQSLQDLQNMVTNNQGFAGEVGSKLALGTLGGIVPHGIPGSSEANFNAKLNQVVNDVVLPNLTLLHGLGRVTDREFQSLHSALTSLSPNLSEGEFKDELNKVTDLVNKKVQDNQIKTPPQQVELNGKIFNLQADGTYS